MACFLVPGTEAIVTTIVTKAVEKKEKENKKEGQESVKESGIKLSTKLGWLNNMLWGGSALLAFEHVWHGEVIPSFPFLTAVREGDAAGMLHEMGTAGVCMAVLVTLTWAGMVWVSSSIEKRKSEQAGADSGEMNA
ncbi:MAG: hypothetical protein K5888_06880 [Lachnospiraceae bacterium]|nr:hypothetical protein [Lachnospiraceae bacterium]